MQSNDSPCWGKLKDKFAHAEEIDVGVVDGEVDGDVAGAPADPQPLLQLPDDVLRVRRSLPQILHRAGPAVRTMSLSDFEENPYFYTDMK